MTTSVIKEATNALARKYGNREVAKLIELISRLKGSVKPKVKEDLGLELANLVDDSQDLHILHGAQHYNVDFLVTLDRRHFLTEKLSKANLSFDILLPGEFLHLYRKSLEK